MRHIAELEELPSILGQGSGCYENTKLLIQTATKGLNSQHSNHWKKKSRLTVDTERDKKTYGKGMTKANGKKMGTVSEVQKREN